MSRAAGRAERLRFLEKKYLQGAYTDEELAELAGVGSRATIYKDRQLLEKQGIEFIEVERGRWKIDRSKYISNLRINLYESAMLYLMARKAARQTRYPNLHVVSVLETPVFNKRATKSQLNNVEQMRHIRFCASQMA